jgi:peptidoglycan/xylan/chitin deacetylase (PgdA/CDA1 family)
MVDRRNQKTYSSYSRDSHTSSDAQRRDVQSSRNASRRGAGDIDPSDQSPRTRSTARLDRERSASQPSYAQSTARFDRERTSSRQSSSARTARTQQYSVRQNEGNRYSSQRNADARGRHSDPRTTRVRQVQPKQPTNKKKPLVIGAAALVVIALGFGVFELMQPSHVEVSIHGETIELPRKTSYADLQDEGYLRAGPGDFVAVDKSVLESGGGNAPTIYANGVAVEDTNQRIKAGDVIEDARGEDVKEPVTTEERVIPTTTTLAAGDDFQFYGNTLHMPLVPAQEGLEVIETGTISGLKALGEASREMVPKMYGDYHPSFGDDNKVVAFTYDDGPHATYTPQMLDVLNKHGVKATFFMLGTSVEANPEMAKRVAEAGHQVASHSYSHKAEHYLNKLDAEGVAYQASTAQRIIKEATGVETKVLRPPGGNLDGKAVLAGSPWVEAYVGWDVGTSDFNKPGTDAIVSVVHENMHPGAIVLMHDGGGDRTQTVEASDILIGQLLEQGYRFVTIDELMEMTRAHELAK